MAPGIPAEGGAATPRPFGERLDEAFAAHGHLCVGIDPHAYLLERWGLPATADGARAFGLRVVEASAGRTGVVKPQISFFERFGSAGYAALEEILGAARAAGLLVIADVKRGDVGSTLDAYSEAWLSPGSPLEADAMTLNPYQGFGTLRHPLELARTQGKGLFVLAATSNPESASVQTSRRVRGSMEGRTVAGGVAGRAAAWNRAHASGATGSVGVVLGATVDMDALGIDLDELGATPRTPILAPGFGHQGVPFENVRDIFGAAADATIVNASRSLLEAGPSGLVDAIDRQNEVLQKAFQ